MGGWRVARSFAVGLTGLLLGVFLLASQAAHAASVETLLMPGKVSEAHAKYEDTCTSCHDRSLKRTQTALCLDCHKEIAADIAGARGYHGRMTNAGHGECKACHSEHKGRAADLVKLDPGQFVHKQTDFALEGVHATLTCDACHKQGVAWRKVVTTCAGCHKADDIHKGQFTQGPLAKSCGECHSTMSWSGGKYDHAATGFALTGAHQTTSCNACHIGGRYSNTPKTCFGCHATDDVHRGQRGELCSKCHTTSDWKSAQFDHFKETGFALVDAHAHLDCASCHRSGNYKDKIPKDCFGCHRADDSHAGRMGTACESCHAQDVWKPVKYDHAAKAHFALVGVHASIGCHTCHTAPVATQKLGKDCVSCHRAEDPHGGKTKGNCDTCHGQNGWRTEVSFDHDLSSYPLTGLHRVVSCAQCHTSLAFGSAKTLCVDCHARDDFHKGGLGTKCESCHTTAGWGVWSFDHGKQTGFAIDGAHTKLNCADCHKEPPGTIKMNRECVACHRRDDRHLGMYGTSCERCHSTLTFKGARVR
jgi:hypothetical protein